MIKNHGNVEPHEILVLSDAVHCEVCYDNVKLGIAHRRCGQTMTNSSCEVRKQVAKNVFQNLTILTPSAFIIKHDVKRGKKYWKKLCVESTPPRERPLGKRDTELPVSKHFGSIFWQTLSRCRMRMTKMDLARKMWASRTRSRKGPCDDATVLQRNDDDLRMRMQSDSVSLEA